MKKLLFFISVVSIVGLTSPALLAHTNDVLDSRKAPNGGQLRMAGIYHYELVVVKDSKEAKTNPVIVYVTDHTDVKIPTSGAKGTVTILTGKQKLTATLLPDGDNRLKGSASYVSAPDMKVVVSITLPGKAAEQAQFTPLAKMMPTTKDGHVEHKH